MRLQDEIVKKIIWGTLCVAAGSFFGLFGWVLRSAVDSESRIDLVEKDISYIRMSIADIRNVMIEHYPDIVRK